MRFDWYQATVPENPVVLVEALRNALASDGEVEEGRGRHNYHQAFTVRDGTGERVALVLAGGPNGDPNVTASGVATDAFVPFLREHWPSHRVTRFDSAEDLRGEGAYEAAEAVCRGVARDLGVKGRAIVPDDLAEGRTYYLGAASSDVRVRLYDKTAQLRRALSPELAAEVPDNVARLECQVRPVKEFKVFAASMEPSMVWGFARWTSELARRALALEVERIMMRAGRESDHDRAYRWMLTSYGNVLREQLRQLGSWDCVGLTIGEDLARFEKWKRQH